MTSGTSLDVAQFRRRTSAILISTSMALCAAGFARAADVPFEIYGALQGDYIQDSKRVDPNWESAFRPSKIETVSGQYGSDGQGLLSVKQSGVGIKGTTTLENGETITFKFNFDMYGVGDNAGQTTFRLQNAYGEWRGLLAGQTDTVFMDLSIFPDTIDYWGPAGMVFVRTAQIRWTPITGPTTLAIAIESPNNDIDPGKLRELDPGIANNIQDDSTLPDLTAHFRMDGDWGHVQLGSILRRLGYDTAGTPDNAPHGHQTGWGLNLTSNIKSVGDDMIHLGVVYGHGIASYMNDGGVDLAPECTLDALGGCTPGTISAKAVPLLGVTAYYDHYWQDHFSTSFGYSETHVDNQSGQTGDAFQSGKYASVNLLWRPVKNVMTGVELLWGQRKNHDGTSGDDSRLQFTVQYKFSSLSMK
jgi:hypothetical protein